MVQNESPPCRPGFEYFTKLWKRDGCVFRPCVNGGISESFFDSGVRWVWSQQFRLWYSRFRITHIEYFFSWTAVAILDTALSNPWIDAGTRWRNCTDNVALYKPKHCGFHIRVFSFCVCYVCFGSFVEISHQGNNQHGDQTPIPIDLQQRISTKWRSRSTEWDQFF